MFVATSFSSGFLHRDAHCTRVMHAFLQNVFGGYTVYRYIVLCVPLYRYIKFSSYLFYSVFVITCASTVCMINIASDLL
jgi:hypothetical protein